MKTREEKIDLMVDKEIKYIRESILVGGNPCIGAFLTAVLRGEGFTPYNKLSDQEIEEEYGRMFSPEYINSPLSGGGIQKRKDTKWI